MHKKLTTTTDERNHVGRLKAVGPRKISRIVDNPSQPPVTRIDLDSAYAEMARDRKREENALEWAENLFKDLNCETSRDLVG